MTKLNVVLRTCDRVSLSANRMYPKTDVIVRCLKSLVTSLRNSGYPYSIHIIDDFSSSETKKHIQDIATEATFNFLPERDQTGLTGTQKSRYSVQVAYEYIRSLPDNELVYIVEDDYLHYPLAISKMLEAKEWFHAISDPSIHIGIFPQDFNQLYYHPNHKCNYAYVGACLVAPGPDRYWRTTWYTHESFMVDVSLIHKHFDKFSSLLRIGFEDGAWEGNTISQVWKLDDVKMLMPLGTLVVHLGSPEDVSFYVNDLPQLWDLYA